MSNPNYLKWDILDIIFEGRNKDYGAYELRKKYPEAITRATLGVILSLTLLLAAPYIYNKWIKGADEVVVKTRKGPTSLEPPPSIDKTKPPPPPPVLPPQVKIEKFTPPVVVPDKEMNEKDEMPPMDSLDKSQIGKFDQQGDTSSTYAPPDDNTGPTEDKKEDLPLTFVEVSPEYPGGEDALYKYLSDNIKYPPVAKDAGITGRVQVQFIVERDGSISGVTILRGLEGGCSEEAMRVVRNMPRWKPGSNNGVAQRVYFTLPIVFQID